MSGRYERAAGYVVFRKRRGRREYLIVKNRSGGHWGFPKGHVEEGEDEGEAARRELAEEVGISSIRTVPGYSRTIHYSFVRDGEPIKKDVTFFLGETAEEGRPDPAELSEMRWLPFQEALLILTYPEQRDVLREAEEFLSKGEARP